MLNPNLLFANHASDLMPFLQNLAVGVIGLISVMWITIFFLRRTMVHYEITARIHLGQNRYNRVFLSYMVGINSLMLIQVASILVWAGLIIFLGLVEHPFTALMFAGSCYTTIGIISDIMPAAWKLLAIFIALSGLFGLALSTASMLSMGVLFRKAWYRKHDKSIRAQIGKAGLQELLDELEVSEGLTPTPDNEKRAR
jgi:hypothetical protein